MGRVGRNPRSNPQPPKVDPQQELAWKAVRNFNRMLPTLTSFARALTGNNKVNVRAGKNTETDGTTIWMRPPLGLGETIQHESSLCDIRNDTLTPLCPACRRNDDVWSGLHHEMSHILMGSFKKVTPEMRQIVAELVDEWHPADACNHARDLHNKMSQAENYLPMFGIFSKFLWMIHQAIDDSRVDSAMLNIKPGLRNQFYSTTYRAFADGVEDNNGNPTFWRDAPVNAQVVVGMMLIASGCEIRQDWLRLEVFDILDDDKLQDILADAVHWGDVEGAAERTVLLFRRLNDMGICLVEKCVKPPPMPSLNNPSDEEDSDDGDPQSGDDTAGDEDSGDDDQESDSDWGGSSGSDGSSDDDSEAESDSTGTGASGDDADNVANDGAFGNNFENEDTSSDRSDKEGGDSVDQSDEESVPDDGDDDDLDDDRGSSDQREAESDEQPGSDGGQDQTDSVSSAGTEDEIEADDDATEADSQGDSGSSTSSESSGTDGNRDAQDSDGHLHGESEGDEEETELDSRGDGSFDPDESKSSVESTHDDASAYVSGEEDDADDDSGDEPVGEDVWSEEYDDDTPQAIRSIPEEELGDADLAEVFFEKFTGHSSHDEDVTDRLENDLDQELDDEILVARRKAIEEAVGQAAFFDRASVGVGEVIEYEFPTKLFGWVDRGWGSDHKSYMPTEMILGRALLKARIVFAENQRSRHVSGLKSGRVNSRVLGKRAALGDERLFKKRIAPGKRDYIVGITVDCSGSTQGVRIERIKRAVFAKAELLHRLGVKFYITAHTGGMERWWTEGYDFNRDYGDELENLMILWVKKPDEPWTDATRKRLATLTALANNFDGHTLEFHRKILERRTETDKILTYYTDGAMPAANYDEELVILTDELAKYRQKNITLLGVGINTDSPSRYGLDTVQVDSDDDLIKVVNQLERYLLR